MAELMIMVEWKVDDELDVWNGKVTDEGGDGRCLRSLSSSRRLRREPRAG
jgi:hypothetical protein